MLSRIMTTLSELLGLRLVLLFGSNMVGGVIG